MAEDLKEKIYDFLKENAGKKFSLLKLKVETKYSYNTISKWVAVLIEEKRNPPIQIEDYGNIKLVWIEKE